MRVVRVKGKGRVVMRVGVNLKKEKLERTKLRSQRIMDPRRKVDHRILPLIRSTQALNIQLENLLKNLKEGQPQKKL